MESKNEPCAHYSALFYLRPEILLCKPDYLEIRNQPQSYHPIYLNRAQDDPYEKGCVQWYVGFSTADIAAALARAGAGVVSGMARGIDAAAHVAALSTTGATIAVLGTGVDVAYPAAHRALRERIASTGLLLSEELPGDRANGGSFPKRNRIIAALAGVTIVTEAPVRSGALITARYAMDLGRTVAAVPGPIDSPQSAGSNALLRDGAYAIASVDDALGLIDAAAPARAQPSLDDPDERAVWDALGRGPADIDSLAALARLPARTCLAAVTALEVRGAIMCTLTGEIRRR